MAKGGPSLFEGPEKKLELVLTAPMPDFKTLGKKRWRKVVAASGAEVISGIANRSMKAYLLSESSLFVWPDRLLLITCGQTNPLNALPALLDVVPSGLIGRVFYVRKNFLFPSRQQSDFEAEVATILPLFPGKSYRLGPANNDHLHLFYSTHSMATFKKDVTFELLMRGLPEDALFAFCSETAASARNRPIHDRLRAACKGMTVDDHFFSPDGYSLNAVRGRRYFTVHVTPQRPGSYASMETNLAPTALPGLLNAMLSIFRPGRFTLALTTSMDRKTRGAHKRFAVDDAPYTIADRSRYEFDCGYMVSFANYLRTSRT
jgi:S-adenosylmethionine decarboxylase